MDNALYYTFSTIAQTLAGAIAFLGAFALYRLQVIATTLQDLGLRVIQPYLPDDKALQLHAGERYADLSVYIHSERPHNNGAPLNAYQIAQRSSFTRYVQFAQTVPILLARALAATVVVMVGAVVVLATTPLLAPSLSLACAAFTIGIASFVGCLSLHAHFVYRALK